MKHVIPLSEYWGNISPHPPRNRRPCRWRLCQSVWRMRTIRQVAQRTWDESDEARSSSKHCHNNKVCICFEVGGMGVCRWFIDIVYQLMLYADWCRSAMNQTNFSTTNKPLSHRTRLHCAAPFIDFPPSALHCAPINLTDMKDTRKYPRGCCRLFAILKKA